MDNSKFWYIIEHTKRESNGETDQQAVLLANALAQLPDSEIIEFDSIFDRYMSTSYTWELWGAAYIINGGCSDDCFDYFRAWLIAQGETVFRTALQDPDSLADIAEFEEAEAPQMIDAAHFAYSKKREEEIPEYTRVSRNLTGEEWDENNIESRYPKLAAKFIQ